MSIVRDTFYNIRCDSCGTELCEEWYHDVGNDEFATILSESGWFTADGNHIGGGEYGFYLKCIVKPEKKED